MGFGGYAIPGPLPVRTKNLCLKLKEPSRDSSYHRDAKERHTHKSGIFVQGVELEFDEPIHG